MIEVKAKKTLGQNFLTSNYIAGKIARISIGNVPCGVIEIGSGLGALTFELAKLCSKVIAIEVDRELAQILTQELNNRRIRNVEVICEDILDLDLNNLIAKKFGELNVCIAANLPYYITSPILVKLLKTRLPLELITVMVQKEMAERICASLKTRECGAISFLVRHHTKPKKMFLVSRGNFRPVPNVDSAVIQLDFHKQQPIMKAEDEELLFELIRGCFSQRRKIILNSLSVAASITKADAGRLLKEAEIGLNTRPEQMELEDFYRIVSAMKNIKIFN